MRTAAHVHECSIGVTIGVRPYNFELRENFKCVRPDPLAVTPSPVPDRDGPRHIGTQGQPPPSLPLD
jgi:hypothetical protein